MLVLVVRLSRRFNLCLVVSSAFLVPALNSVCHVSCYRACSKVGKRFRACSRQRCVMLESAYSRSVRLEGSCRGCGIAGYVCLHEVMFASGIVVVYLVPHKVQV